MAEPFEDCMTAEVALDIQATLTRIGRIMADMPFGGTYFHQPSVGSHFPIAQRLRNIEQNLADLRDGLKRHAEYHNQLESERGEMVSDLAGLGRIIRKALSDGS